MRSWRPGQARPCADGLAAAVRSVEEGGCARARATQPIAATVLESTPRGGQPHDVRRIFEADSAVIAAAVDARARGRPHR
jgi:hypothetical protein